MTQPGDDRGAAAFEAAALTFSYGERPIVQDVNLRVRRGEFVALLGPNGAGKTTLLHLLSGTLRPRAGSVRLFDREVGSLGSREIARLVGVVPQESSSNFDFTNREVVLMGRVVHADRFALESEEDYRAAAHAMRQTRTECLADRGFMAVSGGERQRVVIAQVLAQEPLALLLDEPTANLDINHQIEIMHLIDLVRRDRALAVVAVLHDMNLAAQFADRVVLLKDGRIHSEDVPRKALVPMTIRDIYDARVIVEAHPSTNKAHVVPLYERAGKTAGTRGTRVHVVGGAGSGGYMLSALASAGFSVSTSIMWSIDADQKAAERLAIPFARLAADTAEKTPCGGAAQRDLIRESSILVIARVPLTSAACAIISEETSSAPEQSVYLVDADGVTDRDRAAGAARELFRALRLKGAVDVPDEETLVATLCGKGGHAAAHSGTQAINPDAHHD
jgi:iron complex transport system ATP-binding protein